MLVKADLIGRWDFDGKAWDGWSFATQPTTGIYMVAIYSENDLVDIVALHRGMETALKTVADLKAEGDGFDSISLYWQKLED